MSTEGDLPAALPPDPGTAAASTPAAPATRSWLGQHRRLLIPGGAVLALGAVSAAAVLLLSNPASTIEKMLPASADVVAVANLDPSVTQKVNLMRAVHSFPDVKTDQAIDDKLNQVLKDTGFSYTADVKPWIGSRLAVIARLNLTSGPDSPVAVLVASRDDAKARAMLAKLRTTPQGASLQWKDETYNGITISVGTPSDAYTKAGAYSLFDHAVVFATTSAQIHEIIDTDQGRAPRMIDSSDFKATLRGLPADRLAYLYLNGKSVVGAARKEMARTPALSLALKDLNDAEALQGVGATLSSNGDGVLADVLVKLDQSKLSPATREALAHPGQAETIVSWVPKSSDAFLAITNLNRTIQSLFDRPQASIGAGTDALGLTGVSGVLPHLTGDAGLEVEVGASGLPAAALLLGTDDARSMNAFFHKLLVLAEGAAGSSFGSSSARAGHTTSTTYRGVVITSWSSPALGQLGAGVLTPSYAVVEGMGILGSTADEVRAVIDAHRNGTAIASDATYRTATAASLSKPSAIVYVDIARLLDAVRKSPLGPRIASDKTLSANADPLKALIITATSSGDRASERFFLIVR